MKWMERQRDPARQRAVKEKLTRLLMEEVAGDETWVGPWKDLRGGYLRHPWLHFHRPGENVLAKCRAINYLKHLPDPDRIIPMPPPEAAAYWALRKANGRD